MATLRIPPNIPKPTLQEMRECPIIKQFDDLGIWFGINPTPPTPYILTCGGRCTG